MGIETSVLRFSYNAKSFSVRSRRIVRVRHPCAASPCTETPISCQVIRAVCAIGSFLLPPEVQFCAVRIPIAFETPEPDFFGVLR